MTANTEQPLVVLFDDERSFTPGFRDDAVVIRSLAEAEVYFADLIESGQRISELWLDFVLSPGSVDQMFWKFSYDFPGQLVDRALYQSDASSGHGLIAECLEESGFTGKLERPAEAFPGVKIFS